MVGTCSEPDALRAEDADADLGVSTDAVKSAKSVRDRHEDELKGVPGVVGTGIGADETGHAEIQVYVEKLTPQAQAGIPAEVEGTPVKAVETGAFVAY
jgi:ssDNA-binding replication factor A large subunit